MKPIIKWAGGKTKLLPELIALMPKSYSTYYEPMCGGAALYWSLPATNSCVLADSNADLINMYQRLVLNPTELCELLQQLQRANEEAFYYHVREKWNTKRDLFQDVERAAIFIYLNKACYNGLWRVNKAGLFNVPYCENDSVTIYDPEHIHAASNHANDTFYGIRSGDYFNTTKDVTPRSFIYFDPPYDKVKSDSFTAYTSSSFDHARLAGYASALVKHGCKVMLSHSDTPYIRTLYPAPTWSMYEVQCARSINSDGAKRGKVGELIITGGY